MTVKNDLLIYQETVISPHFNSKGRIWIYVFYLTRLNKWNRIKISFKAFKFICKESEKGLCQNI